MFYAFAIVGLFVIVVGVVNGARWLTALGAVELVGCIVSLRLTANGANPRLFHAPLDKR